LYIDLKIVKRFYVLIAKCITLGVRAVWAMACWQTAIGLYDGFLGPIFAVCLSGKVKNILAFGADSGKVGLWGSTL